MRDIRVGLVGYGMAGSTFHAPFVTVTPGMTLQAVVSRNRAKIHADFPDLCVYPTIEALLASPDIDLVIISSPDEFHAAHALAALRANKHVLVDKPFATTLSDARAISKEAVAQNRLLTVFQNRRWDADFLTLRRILGEGVLGEIVELRSCFDQWNPSPAALWREARMGGSWFDLGAHLVDQALCLFGQPLAVSADVATLRENAVAPDYFNVTLRYPRLRVILHSSKLTARNNLRFAVHGTVGSWIKHGQDTQSSAIKAGMAPIGDAWGIDHTTGCLTIGDDPANQIPVLNERGDYRKFWLQLAAAIRGEGMNPVPAHEAISVMEILEAGLVSSLQRCEVFI